MKAAQANTPVAFMQHTVVTVFHLSADVLIVVLYLLDRNVVGIGI